MIFNQIEMGAIFKSHEVTCQKGHFSAGNSIRFPAV